MKMDTRRLTISLERSQFEQIREFCIGKGWSYSRYFRVVSDSWLEWHRLEGGRE